MSVTRWMWWCVLWTAWLPAQQLHVANYSGERFEGWIRRGIDWEPAVSRGTVQGRAFATGRALGPGVRVLDVYVELERGERLTLDFGSVSAAAGNTGEPFVCPQPTIAGVPFVLRAAHGDGAGLDVHWRALVGELVVDLWCVLHPGQTWTAGELQVTAHGPSRAAVVPPGFVLSGGPNFVTCLLGAQHCVPILPAGTTIAAGQGCSTLPIVFAENGGDLMSAAAASGLTIGAVGLREVWPLGNPSWAPSRGSPQRWLAQHYARSRGNLLGWNADPIGVVANANVTGGEGDQVFVGAECSRGAASAGAELPNLFVAYGYARRPGKWREIDGDALELTGHEGLAMFEGYPFARGGSVEMLGLTEIPSREEAHGWAEWREHWFRNRLFVAYRLTGSLALQWQIDQLARQYLYEHTLDPQFSTTQYVGAARGYGWSALMVWWLHHTLEDRAVAAAVRERWRGRWAVVGAPRYENTPWWDVRRDDRLGPGLQLLAYQQAAATMFVDMAGEVCGVPAARQAALRGATAILDHAYWHNGARWLGFGTVRMIGGKPVALPQGGTFGPGIEAWMAGAVAVVLRHRAEDARARAILAQTVAENPVNGQWIAPDVLR